MPFIMKYEGKVLDKDGNHVLYDDDVNAVTKRRWNGKGGINGIKAFIASCKGKPTIGYGITDKNIILKGKISDSEAKNLVLKRIKRLNLHLFKKYPIYSKLNPNQKTALISFTFNLGQHFIELSAEKMHTHLLNGNLNGACYEMHDCNKVRVGEQKKLVESRGLTNRRQAEMKLFKTPWKN